MSSIGQSHINMILPHCARLIDVVNDHNGIRSVILKTIDNQEGKNINMNPAAGSQQSQLVSPVIKGV
jgi:hypothetical protein